MQQEAHGVSMSVLRHKVERCYWFIDIEGEGEGDKEFDGLTKNLLGAMRRV
jgi:hypothetical protein